MKTITASILLLLTISAYAQTELPKPFADLLEKTGLTFNPTPKFKETPVIKNGILNYDYAQKLEPVAGKGTCELRFLIVPEDPTNPVDKESFSRSFGSTLSSIYTTPFVFTESFRVEGGDLTNNADFIAIDKHYKGDGLNYKPEFAQQSTEGMTIAMYKKGLGTAYIFLLGGNGCSFNDMAAFYTLTFKK